MFNLILLEATTFDMQGILASAATQLSDEIIALISVVAPVIIGIMVSIILLKGGLAIFKKLTGKAV